MRAVAVIFVVVDHTCLALRVHHLGRWDPGWLGMLGVFLFFVHTSLVLMWSLERRPHVLDFYIRRVFRIYPLALLAIGVAVVSHAPTAGDVQNFFGTPRLTAVDVLTHCLLLQDLRPGTPPLVNVMWTLPLEVQMYVLLPVLFFFARGQKTLWPLLLIWVLVFSYCRVTFAVNAVDLATVVPMFIPGVMAYVGFARRVPSLPGWLFGVFVALIASVFMVHPSNRRGWYVALSLGLLLPFFRQLRWRPVVRTSHYIAQYSYGMYLSHPFALVIGMYLFKAHAVWLQLSVETLVIVAVSVGAYHLLEEPMIRVGARLAAEMEFQYEEGVSSGSSIRPGFDG